MVYEQRLDDISDALLKLRDPNEKLNKELLKYIPIATVACFEAFFQNMIKLLIDSGAPYNANISGFNQSKNVRLDFDVVAAIQSKTLTIGEFVAHLLPYNNLEDISANFKTITDKELITEMKIYCEKPGPPYIDSHWQKFRDNPGSIINGVTNTFNLRHIFCHEFATNVQVDVEQITENFECCYVFLTISYRYILHLLHPDSSGDTKQNTLNAIREFQEAEACLHDTIKQIEQRTYKFGSYSEWRMDLLADSIVKWKAYRDSRAHLKSDLAKGTDFYEIWHNRELTNITLDKINSLKEEFGEVLIRDVVSEA
jgi:hypothetical protein